MKENVEVERSVIPVSQLRKQEYTEAAHTVSK